MKDSLLVGDFLFVSKLHYGIRIPITQLSIPLIHNNFLGIQYLLSKITGYLVLNKLIIMIL